MVFKFVPQNAKMVTPYPDLYSIYKNIIYLLVLLFIFISLQNMFSFLEKIKYEFHRLT